MACWNHYYLGLENEAKKYAKILGYNYNSSEWFEKSIKFLIKITTQILKILLKNRKSEKALLKGF